MDADKKTLENLIYRLRKKLGGTFELSHQGGGTYQLHNIRAL
jgi:hypothetical protein